MSPYPPPAPGNPAGGPPAPPPLDPYILDALLSSDPSRAAAILSAMRPAVRNAQAQAHAALCGVAVARIRADWERLIARAGSPLARPPRDDGSAVPYDPEILALLEPAAAQDLIAALGSEQRAAQARAQADWLSAFGYPVLADDILADWAATMPPSPLSHAREMGHEHSA
ncbi:hypothetical protein K2Z83_22890 [Oscillochloris sp. ZM17-4]|uniref:hypothetical protein n=1 Tax=Oscillochloris sp. ZM17-4 TaxID=2866714 RepID=UPI001C73062E|nr:hypothetical protein [Oscillochloris sp. ZM17-4]MBX0330506.1 hypothetical protein [Oscillochloris sp. ZM17-4]